MCFFVAALIPALFQETAFNQVLVQSDIWFAIILSIISILGAATSSRIVSYQMADMANHMQTIFANLRELTHRDGHFEGEGYTVEREMIDCDDDPSGGKTD